MSAISAANFQAPSQQALQTQSHRKHAVHSPSLSDADTQGSSAGAAKSSSSALGSKINRTA